jgi:hypothetical protein
MIWSGTENLADAFQYRAVIIYKPLILYLIEDERAIIGPKNIN